jgi:hypothetical protein
MTTSALDSPEEPTPTSRQEAAGIDSIYSPGTPFWTRWLGFIAYLDLFGSFFFGSGLRRATEAVVPVAETMFGRLDAVLTAQPSFAGLGAVGLGILVLREESQRLERLLGSTGYLGLAALSVLIGNVAALAGFAEPTGIAAPFVCVLFASAAWTQNSPPKVLLSWGQRAWVAVFILVLLVVYDFLLDGRTWPLSVSAAALVGNLVARHYARRRWNAPPTDAPPAEASP